MNLCNIVFFKIPRRKLWIRLTAKFFHKIITYKIWRCGRPTKFFSERYSNWFLFIRRSWSFIRVLNGEPSILFIWFKPRSLKNMNSYELIFYKHFILWTLSLFISPIITPLLKMFHSENKLYDCTLYAIYLMFWQFL